MIHLRHHGLERALRSLSTADLTRKRHASLTSAISRGIRKATGHVDRLGSRPRRPREGDQKTQTTRTLPGGYSSTERSIPEKFEPPRTSYRSGNEGRQPSNFGERAQQRENSDTNYSNMKTRQTRQRQIDNSTSDPRTLRAPKSRFEMQRWAQTGIKSPALIRRERRKIPLKEDISDEAPQGVPYSVAGSEFVYGTFSVKAALEARRRRIHKLYIWRGERTTGDEYDASIALLARSKRISVQHVAGNWDKMLMKMSGQRPHNGYILEADPIPKLPITSLQYVEGVEGQLSVNVAAQSLEDQATNKIFGATTLEATIARTVKTRFPLLLWLDRITDTGNIGAIIRTAYFFGIDAVIVPEHGTAPLNPVTVKASAGAAEHLPILVVKKETEFITASQKNGWRFLAAVAPESVSTKKKAAPKANGLLESQALLSAPCVLMVGNEGEGLRPFMQQAADEAISIDGVQRLDSGVDSLNVSVAAALLMARLLTISTPRHPGEKPQSTSSNSSIVEDEKVF